MSRSRCAHRQGVATIYDKEIVLYIASLMAGKIDLATFRLQVGYQNPLANFRAAMKAIAQADAIPDYQVALVEDAEAEEPAEGRGARASCALRQGHHYRASQGAERAFRRGCESPRGVIRARAVNSYPIARIVRPN
jgi:hypothetical protein